MYERFCDVLQAQGVKRVERGVFGAHMDVRLLNDGPVTLIVDTVSSLAAVQAAGSSGAHIGGRIGDEEYPHKGRIDLVTDIDLRSEQAIRRICEVETPKIPVFAEEGGGAEFAQTRWIVDPLDGTTNYVRRLSRCMA